MLNLVRRRLSWKAMYSAFMLEVLGLFVWTLGVSVFLTKHVSCHMLKFAGHRPAMK